MAKVFYDAGKEVYDVSGTKTLVQIQSEYGFGPGTQEVTLAANEAQEIVGGVLQKFNVPQRTAAQAAAKEAARQGKENSIRAKLGLTPAEFADLKEALG